MTRLSDSVLLVGSRLGRYPAARLTLADAVAGAWGQLLAAGLVAVAEAVR
jgi:hypothetical protein